jgi:pantoate--beta-alanine ligase
MHIFEQPSDIIDFIKAKRLSIKKIGLVPTMGALHEGHMSLFRFSKNDNDVTIGSIFVNPIQFNNLSDLEKYPRPLEKDLKMLENIGCDAIFIPSAETMYPSKPVLNLNFGILEHVMEGKFRPGHFNGVGIVVSKLFNIIDPDHAYFGQKDLQQFLVIQQMVKDLSFRIKLTACPIVREADGLAMSSRNIRLSNEKRKVASKLKESLDLAASLIDSQPVELIQHKVMEFIAAYPDFKLEYFEIADYETLAHVKDVKEHKGIALCIAAHLDGVRLMDNFLLIS